MSAPPLTPPWFDRFDKLTASKLTAGRLTTLPVPSKVEGSNVEEGFKVPDSGENLSH